MNLKMLQEHFVHSLTTNSINKQLEKLVIPGGSLKIEEAMTIYRGDYQARMKEALSKNFEATWLFLGDEDFFRQAELYIFQYPSTLDNLTNYGEFFPEFIKEVSLEASQMATFEKAFWKYFHSEDKTPFKLTPEFISESSLNLLNLTLISSELSLDFIWENRETVTGISEDLDLFEPSYFALYKKEEKVEVVKVLKVEFEILVELSMCLKISELAPRELKPENWSRIFEIVRYAHV